jgi:hypothetical protein
VELDRGLRDTQSCLVLLGGALALSIFARHFCSINLDTSDGVPLGS